MEGLPALMVPVLQLVVLPVLAGYLVRRGIGGTTGTESWYAPRYGDAARPSGALSAVRIADRAANRKRS